VFDGQHSVRNWKDFEALFSALEAKPPRRRKRQQWLYRGEGNWDQELQTSLEKDAAQYRVPLSRLYHAKIKKGLIRRFKRENSRHAVHVPEQDDHVGWLSIMQHHGAPTRLLDITYSIYVALYFALWTYRPNGAAGLWCINYDWLSDAWDEVAPDGYHQEYDRDTSGRYLDLYKLVLRDRKSKVYPIAPYHFPERLVLQQSGFLLPLDVTKPFMANLASMPKDPVGRAGRRSFQNRVLKVRIKLATRDLEEVRYRLLRMNINNATLFPGLDGYAGSLRDRFPFQEQREGKAKGFN